MASPLPPGYPPSAELEIVSQLEGMGFSRELSEQAIAGTEGGTLQSALDWLVHLCQTPRQEAPEPSPRSTEEEELSRAIQMSLTVQSPAAVPPGMPPAIARQPSEEEDLEAAIAASLSDLRQDTARAIEQVESYQTAEAQRHSMLQRLPSSMVKLPHVTWLSPLLP